MTVAPATLAQMIASTRVEALHRAVVARLGGLMPGVAVVGHPGRLDINDIVARAVVSAPGVAVGWSRLRGRRDLGGTYAVPIDFVAYLVVEDYADTQAGRRIARDTLAHAIGARLLRILGDADTASWGIAGVAPPEADPEPEMRPVFTVKSAEFAAALYAVTWTQMLLDEGEPVFGGPTPGVRQVPDGLEFDIEGVDANGLPVEILAALAGDEP